MFLLAHMGIPLISVYLLDRITDRSRTGSWHPRTWRFDARLVIMMALLPDIIDKFVGHVLLANTLNNGRLFSHSLLFWAVVSLLLASTYLFRKRFRVTSHAWPLYSLALLSHTICDQMWLDPHTYFWPFLGLSFRSLAWVPMDWVKALFSDPFVITTEILGAVFISTFILATGSYSPRSWRKLLRYGWPRDK